jgi:hypothetical protein
MTIEPLRPLAEPKNFAPYKSPKVSHPTARRRRRDDGAEQSLAALMFPNVFPSGMKMAPGEVSGSHFTW